MKRGLLAVIFYLIILVLTYLFLMYTNSFSVGTLFLWFFYVIYIGGVCRRLADWFLKGDKGE